MERIGNSMLWQAIAADHSALMHDALAVLTARKALWATLPVREKVGLLEELKARIGRLNREDWAREAVQVTGVDPDMVAPAPEPSTCTPARLTKHMLRCFA